MTAAQKTAKDKFKKAIEYRKKTGVSLKEAFAHAYGKKVSAVKKKAAPKKKAAVKKAAPKKKAPTTKSKISKLGALNKKILKGGYKIKPGIIRKNKIAKIDKISNEFISSLKEANDRLIKYQNVLLVLMDQKNTKTISPIRKKTIAFDIKTVKNVIKEQKIHIRELKKNIK